MVYLERKRIAERDASEALGVDLWTEELTEAVRGKLVALLLRCCGHNRNALYWVDIGAHRLVREATGFLQAPKSAQAAFVEGTVELVLSYIDAVRVVLLEYQKTPPSRKHDYHYEPTHWEQGVSEILASHRIKFKFVDGQLVPLGSEVMHTEVVERTLVLVHGRLDFVNVEKAFRDALEEIANGKPDDAITDAGTALQETLTAVGCRGNTLGDLLKDAKQNGWFGPRDSPLADSIAKIHSWVAAERNAGEAHRVSDVSEDDAWFVVHVVGAAIVRLAAGSRSAPRSAGR